MGGWNEGSELREGRENDSKSSKHQVKIVSFKRFREILMGAFFSKLKMSFFEI